MDTVHKIIEAIMKLAKGPLGSHEESARFVPWPNTILWALGIGSMCAFGVFTAKFASGSLIALVQAPYAPLVFIAAIIASAVVSVVTAWIGRKRP